MTPTMNGRIQSRIVLLVLIGIPVALFLGLVLPRPNADATLGDMYRVFFTALLLVGVVGVVWEIIYHALQQFRWEKDWPTLFGLVTGLPEAVVVYLLLKVGIPWDVGDVPLGLFVAMFTAVWIAVWLVANGPLQIVFIRWRYRGGRFV